MESAQLGLFFLSSSYYLNCACGGNAATLQLLLLCDRHKLMPCMAPIEHRDSHMSLSTVDESNILTSMEVRRHKHKITHGINYN